MSDTSGWWNIFRDGNAAGSPFRAAPDPLLDLQPRFPDLNLYQPGPIFVCKFRNKPTEHHNPRQIAATNPRFAAAWNAHPSRYLHTQHSQGAEPEKFTNFYHRNGEESNDPSN